VPTTWTQTKNFLKEYTDLGEVVIYDVCPVDCILFRNEYEAMIECPSCDSKRYKVGVTKTGKPTAVRKFPTVPVMPRIRSMFANPEWSKLLGYGSNQTPQANNERTPYRDVYAGSNFQRVLGPLKVSKYEIYFRLGSDSIVAREHDNYSIVPLLLTLCMIDPELRFTYEFVFPYGWIPGPGHNNVEIFWAPFLDELAASQNGHFKIWDCLTQEHHLCRLWILSVLLDLRGLASFTSGMQHPCKIACHRCENIGVRVDALHTTVYPGWWLHLPVNDPLRIKAFASKVPGHDVLQNAPPFAQRTHTAMIAAGIESGNDLRDEGNPNHVSRRNFMKRPAWTLSIRGWDLRNSVSMDSCHQIANMGKLFAKMSLGIQAGQIARNSAVHRMELLRGRWTEQELFEMPWAMYDDEIDAFNGILRNIDIPRRRGGKLKALLVKKNIGRYKMINYWRFLGELGVYVLRKAKCFNRHPQYREFWIDMFLWIFRYTSSKLVRADVADLELRAIRLHARYELLFPTAGLTWVMHYMPHMSEEILLNGQMRLNNMMK
jgi:hypothetical protein